MSRTSFLIAAALLITPLTAFAQSGVGTGLGLILGDPHNGISFKTYSGSGLAIDGAIGLDLLNDDHLVGHVDGLLQTSMGDVSGAPMIWYYGLGGTIAAYDGTENERGTEYDYDAIWLGVRAPLGIAWEFQSAPFDIFAEGALILWVVQDVELDIDTAIGGRYWF